MNTPQSPSQEEKKCPPGTTKGEKCHCGIDLYPHACLSRPTPSQNEGDSQSWEEDDVLGSAAIQFALELGRVKGLPDLPSSFYEAVENSFVKYAKPVLSSREELLKQRCLEEIDARFPRPTDVVAQDGYDRYQKEIIDGAKEAITRVMSDE